VADSPQHGADRYGCPEFRRNLALDRRGFVKTGAWVWAACRYPATSRASDLLSQRRSLL